MKTVLSKTDIDKIRLARWKARTDLGFLCREVLGYKDVDDYVHGPIMRTLQAFPKPDRKQFAEHDVFDGKTWRYTPLFKHVQELEGTRRRLILVFRGAMKTTINLQAHTIQWIINYPSVALAIFQSNLDKSEDILKSIRHHFRYNETFRRLFPEHCPQTRVDEWGLKNEFTTLARPRAESRREPTVKALSIDKENAGYHFDVMKFSDIVEPGTTKTEGAMENTRREFSLAESLLVSPVYWIDVEGTRYTAKEMYQDIIDKWELEHKKGYSHEYEILLQGCFKLKDPKTGKEQTTFTPDTLAWENLLDSNNLPIPWWPYDASGAPRFTLDVLLTKQRNDPYDFSCQYLIKPQAGMDGMETFPTEKLQKITLANFRRNVAPRIQYYTIGLDTAHTTNARSNYSAFVVCGWDAANRAYVVDIVRKKLLPNQLVDEIFRLNEQYKPRSFVIEETQFTSGLRVAIESELAKRRARYRQNRIPWNIDYIKPENDKSKETRIKNTLQPVIDAGNLRVVIPPYDPKDPSYNEEAVDTFEAMLKEFRDFPLGSTDDILDALADQFQPKSYFGRLAPRSLTDVTEVEMNAQFERFLNIEPSYHNNRPFPARREGFIPPEYFK